MSQSVSTVKPAIPEKIIEQWQEIVNLLAEVLAVPAALIMKVHTDQIEVFLASESAGNPYEPGEMADLNTGLYCETVMNTRNKLHVPSAPMDKNWDKNPDIELGMIAYLGFPIMWPDGQVFGTICALDSKENYFTPVYHSLLDRLKQSINNDLELIQRIHELEQAKGELHEANKRIEEKNIELKESNEELEAFNRTVSHDLRAPLTVINGYCEMLREQLGADLDKKKAHYLDIIMDTGERMNNLIDDILAFSKSGHMAIMPEKVEVSKVAHFIMKRFQELNPDRQAEVIIQENIKITGDDALLYVVMENLLGNAWKFSGKNDNPRIEFGVTSGDEGTVYYVRDNGVGFDPAKAANLFLPFQRLHSQRDFPGTGIGLATVRKIIHRHNGRIWVESSPGEGATFYFTINE
jgi:signal transduction histidine kinase